MPITANLPPRDKLVLVNEDESAAAGADGGGPSYTEPSWAAESGWPRLTMHRWEWPEPPPVGRP